MKKFHEKVGLETSSRPFFNFQGIFCKKESEEVSVMIWAKFDGFANTYLI